MSLRARVLAGVLVLTTLAMAGLGIVVYSFLDRYLTQRVDEDLQRSSLPIIGYVQRGFIPPDRPDERAFSQPRYFTAVRDAGGTVVKASPVMDGNVPLAEPDLSGLNTVDKPQGVDYLTTDSVRLCSRAGAEPLFYGVGPVGDSRPTSRMQPWRAGSPDALSRAFRTPAVTPGYLSSDH